MKNILLFATVRSGHNFIRQQIESWDVRNEFIIGNFEDVQHPDFGKMKNQIVGHAKTGPGKLFDYSLETIKIIVVRDLLNWWASYVKWISKDGLPSQEKVDLAFKIWTSLTVEVENPHFIPVYYDTFKVFKEYRQDICHQIEGTYNEDRLDAVSPQGEGSSFDKMVLDGHAGSMQTDLRYLQLPNDLYPFYMKGLRDHPGAVEAYTKYLPQTPDQEVLLSRL